MSTAKENLDNLIVPVEENLFGVCADSYGARLALVFGNHARGGECPFLTASRCHHCDIGKGEGIAFDTAMNRSRHRWYRDRFQAVWPSLRHLVVYNSGSLLNPDECPIEFLQELLTWAKTLASLRVVSLDSREVFVSAERVARIVESLRDDQCARIIMGIESADDHIRNGLLRKAMTSRAIQRAFDQIAEAAESFGPNRIGVDVNILIGGPGTTEQTAVEDAVNTASFALSHCPVAVDFNLHPYYPSTRGWERFPDSLRCSASVLLRTIRALADLVQDRERRSQLFIGLQDEGHDTDRSGRADVVSRFGDAVREFNTTQQVAALTAWSETADDDGPNEPASG